MSSKLKPAASLGLVGLGISAIVVWLAEQFGGTNLLGDGAPNFGPFPASGIFIVAVGIVGAIIGAYRK